MKKPFGLHGLNKNKSALYLWSVTLSCNLSRYPHLKVNENYFYKIPKFNLYISDESSQHPYFDEIVLFYLR